MIENLEIHRALGVEKVFIYDSSNISKRLQKALLYYKKSNLVDIIPWSLPVTTIRNRKPFKQKGCTIPGCTRRHTEKCVRNFAQMLHYYDCLYSNMYTCSYIGFWDHDEIFFPNKYSSIPEMLSAIDNSLNFTFGALSIHDSRCKRNWNVNDRTNMSTVTYQSQCFKDTWTPSYVKSIVKPTVILAISIHTPTSILKHHKYLGLKTNGGILYHYHYVDGLNQVHPNKISKYYPQVIKAQSKFQRNSNTI